MAPVNPCSLSNASLPSGTAFTTKKINCLSRYSFLGESSKETLFLPKFTLPLSTSVRLFPPYRNRCVLQCKARTHILSALGTNVAVEEPDSQVENKSSESPSVSVEASEESSIKTDVSPAPVQPKRPRPSRKSEMPPVKNEELVPGASFTGKVRSIQPFGAFIDFGAFTDGLVHISRLSNTYVKDIASFISVGQEVKVWLVEANTETGRISLTMRDNDDISKKDAPGSSDKSRPARKNTYPKKDEVRKTSKFVRGQDLQGTVKNLTRSGAFISLPEGEEGFLPQSEESNEAFVNVMGGSSLRVGQEISARVLRITRGNVTLTMKKKEDIEELNSKLNQGVVHVATNPFVLAFRSNKDIAAFLDERKEVANSAETKEMSKTSEEIDGKVEQIATNSTTLDMKDQSMDTGEELVEETSLGGTNTVYDASSESVKNNEESDGLVSNLANTVDAVQTIQEKVEASAEALASDSEDIIPSAKEVIAKASEISGVETDVEPKLSGERADGILSSEGMVSKEDKGGQAEDASANDKVQIQTSLAENEFTATLAVDAEKVKTVPEKNGSISSSNGQIDISMSKGKLENNEKEDPSGNLPDDQLLSSESQVSVGSVENQVNDTIAEDEVQIQSPLSENNISSTPTEVEKAAVVPEGNSSEQPDVPSPKESSTRAVIAPALVKQLREETGAGMMDCKNALSETGGDIVKAQEFLRKKGLASADKKASRATAEGRIGSYIHYSRIGVLIEVNCETDFVSRGDIFKELVDDLAMQVAACPQVQHLVTEDVPEELINKEREIEMQKEDLLLKPEQIRSKIVEGRIRKRLEELALLEQPYIKNDKVLVKDWLKQTIATIGENIKVKRFVRYNLGEGLQKKSQDFAAEVAAQTAAQPASAPAKEQPVTDATEGTVQKSPAVTVSAALVKQLREETGAGMMDCKKALSETGGDLEKAQAYLRKKGLSTADKKSNRIAAEGRIGSYVHDSRIGVLIEVNCETDFVGRSAQFQELVDDLAMQVVACPPVQFVSVEDIPDSIVRKEKEVEMQREDLLTKPENIRERIVEGRVSKRLGELALLEQPFIKNDSILVKDLVKQTVATLGENVKIRRFVRFTLGETVETAKTSTES